MEQQPPHGGEHQDQQTSSNEHHHQGFFQFGPWVFNIDRALALIAEQPRTVHMAPVDAWAHFYGLVPSEHEYTVPLITPGPGFDRNYAMTTDLSIPVVMATVRGPDGHASPLLIDGCHRLYRAYAEGIPHLPAHLLNVDESVSIREGLRLR